MSFLFNKALLQVSWWSGFDGRIARHFASSARPLSGFGSPRFITDDALRQPLSGVDHGLFSVLRSETLQQASEECRRKVGCPHDYGLP
jgi:hypothetical protein